MARQTHGNLAVQESYYEQQQPKRNPKSTKRSKFKFQFSERALYMLMILVFVIVATIVISRYAAVYELNLRTSQLAADIEQLKMENSELKFKVSQLSDPQSILKDAQKIGMKPVDVKEIEKIGFPVEETKTVVVNQP